ncbi:hypothetical protein IPJ72_00805 [Candidatus Peregrinibacteria bacterium]|nr:MAG: hypothetical protein IPJ72_00805 [Candidatus Peregrinibacteria bacterium]
MPSSIVTGNGNLLVAIDQHNLIRDLYFPFVGMEDQIAYQHKLRLGMYTDHQFSWIDEKEWIHESKYVEDTVVTGSSAKNSALGISLYFNDFLSPTQDVLIRKIT